MLKAPRVSRKESEFADSGSSAQCTDRCQLMAFVSEAQLACKWAFNPAWSGLPHSEILCVTAEV